MRIQRTIPPAAAPIYLRNVLEGLKGLVRGQTELQRFKSEIKEYFGVKHCFLLSSGKAALTMVLQALKDMHPDRNEVLIPAFTCYSVPSVIVRSGLSVKLCDIDADTLDFDYRQLSGMDKQQNSQSRLLAVVPTHLFGYPADVLKLKKAVGDPEVCIIEDAAQAMGGQWRGKKLGTLGDVGLFSLGRGKVLSTVEGGVLLTNQDDLARKIENHIEALRDYSAIELVWMIFYSIALVFFLSPLLFWLPKSLPLLNLGETKFDLKFRKRRMSSFQAGLAKDWLSKLFKLKTSRSARSKHWSKAIETTHFPDHLLNPNSHIALNRYNDSSFIRYPIRVEDAVLRKSILEQSERHGLGIMRAYPDSINRIAELEAEFKGQNYPAAKKLAAELISLPTHPLVTKKDITRIVSLVMNPGQWP